MVFSASAVLRSFENLGLQKEHPLVSAGDHLQYLQTVSVRRMTFFTSDDQVAIFS